MQKPRRLSGGLNTEKTQLQTKSTDQAEKDCDWIALNGWAWWKQVVEDAENKAKNTAREDQ